MTERTIDTHIHIWDLDQAAYPWLEGDTTILNRSYALDELEEERKGAEITEGILVQAASNLPDTDWMLRIAAGRDWIKGVVGWLPLMDPAAAALVLEEKYDTNPLLKGVRHMIHNEPDARWLLQLPVLESLNLLAARDLPYDLVGINPGHIMTALKVAETIPGLRIVIDHLNQPPIATGDRFGLWGELMREAARHEGFFVKISGLGTTAGKGEGWQASELEPYIGFVLEHFGEERCFCGGDWPVSLLAGSYGRTWAAYRECLDKLLDNEGRAMVYYKNAERFYRLL
jgi:L-fuconolactonase